LGPSNPNVGCYVAIEDVTSRLVGAIVFTAERGEEAFIHAVGVVPDRRREGIGTTLKEQAIDYFAYVGALAYRSEVDRFNRAMQELNENRFGLAAEVDGKIIHYAARVDPRSEETGPAGGEAAPKLVDAAMPTRKRDGV
jgi:GNAT superfamily N-acetyltransferase